MPNTFTSIVTPFLDVVTGGEERGAGAIECMTKDANAAKAGPAGTGAGDFSRLDADWCWNRLRNVALDHRRDRK